VFTQSGTLRGIAEKYLWLAKGAKDPGERSKFFDYAMVYAQLSEQSERRETSRGMAGGDVERRDVSRNRGDGIARHHGR
jgi:hypothetical protein